MVQSSDQQIEEIRGRVDIVDVVGRYVALKRSGRNLMGLCPFHQEKTPSFHVQREGQFYHCFGCKESGDVFSFVMKMEGLSFPEALEHLASVAGVQIQRRAPSKAEQKRRRDQDVLLQVNKQAALFFEQHLYAEVGRAAKAYLSSRGLDGKTARRFRLGYAPPRWDGLLGELRRQGFEDSVLRQAGLIVTREENAEPFDMFRHRVIFPIADVRGQIVGFGGRALDPQAKAKYLNTPESPLFSKGEHVYGLPQAKETIRRTRQVIVCEGYTDVVGLAKHGITNAVAALGTAFTAEQAKLLSRWADEVVLAFDADTAGRSAAQRGLDLLSDAGLRVRVAVLPEGEDPDSFVRANGSEAFAQLLTKALPLLDYKIEEALRDVDLATVDGRVRAAQAALPVIAAVESPVAKEAYIERLANRLGSSPQAISLELSRLQRENGKVRANQHRIEGSRYTNTGSAPNSPPAPARPPAPSRPERQATKGPSPNAVVEEKGLLRWVLKDPKLIPKIREMLGDQPFEVERHNRIWSILQEHAADGTNSAFDEDPEMAAAVRHLEEWQPHITLEAPTYLRRLWGRRMRRSLRGLERRLAGLPERDERAYAEQVGGLLQAYQRLRRAVRRHSNDVG